MHFFTVLHGGYFGGGFGPLGGGFGLSFGTVLIFGAAFLGGSFGGLGGVAHGDGFVFAA